VTTQTKPTFGPFEEDLEDHPDEHFLSPIYECDDWTDDDDDDDDEVVEWDAGITDFALFDSDRRRAAETHDPMPSRWGGFIAQQASALQRAVQRNRAEGTSHRKVNLLSADDLPELTPDNSPYLRDDLDVESNREQTPSALPTYLTIIVTPPETDDESDAGTTPFDLPPSTFFADRAKQRRESDRRLERPGLRYHRTLSGKTHAWTRPGRHLYSVGEDVEAEERAE